MMRGPVPTPLRLTEVIPRNAIRFPLESASPDGALAELTRVLVESGRLPRELEENALIGLLKREALGPTGIGHGIAVPHTRVAGLKAICGALGVSSEGVAFRSPDQSLVHAVFLFLAPERDHAGYLQLLALVSRIVQEGGFVPSACEAGTSARLATLLREFEAKILG